MKNAIIKFLEARKQGSVNKYNVENFFNFLHEYKNTGMIIRALNTGTNEDVQNALCKFAENQDRSDLCDYIMNEDWLGEWRR